MCGIRITTAIAFLLFAFARSAYADPTLEFNPWVFVEFLSDADEPDLTVTAQVLSDDASHASTDDGSSIAFVNWGYDQSGFSISGEANADVFGSGTASANIDIDVLFTIANNSAVDFNGSVQYGYGLAGLVSTGNGLTEDSWRIGIDDTNLLLLTYGDYEYQNHYCSLAGNDGEGYPCSNFYDGNFYWEQITLPADSTYFADAVIDLHLHSASAPEPPMIFLFLSGLIGCIFFVRYSSNSKLFAKPLAH